MNCKLKHEWILLKPADDTPNVEALTAALIGGQEIHSLNTELQVFGIEKEDADVLKAQLCNCDCQENPAG